ncbi:MAG: DUF2812 domain-containing protein [Erysipelotrichaceae bacterium]|nr:DUF2812 domain-containing protein [Erysipelotrichaceae bacterium]
MSGIKRRLEAVSFFDHTGISEHLERMASKGWMLEKITNLGWIYRQIEPKNIRFAVSYYPKASEFDPEPSESQKIFHEFCAHTGWKLVCTSAQMQIFYNENDDPIPIETEPELELQAIHASAKKSFIPSYILLTLVGLMNVALWVSNLLGDPIALFSSSSKLFTGVAYLALMILCIVELITYFKWYSEAKKVCGQGIFLKTPNTSKFQKIVLTSILVFAFIWAFDYFVNGDLMKKWVLTLVAIYIPSLFIIVNCVKDTLKKLKASRGMNRTLTFLTSFLVSFGLLGLIIYATLFASSHGVFADKNEETYEHNGMTWIIHQDELPLVVEDLIDIDFDGYIKQHSSDSSLFLAQLDMKQYPRFDAEEYKDIPYLEYTITIVRVPQLYGLCKESILKSHKEAVVRNREYRIDEAELWNANEVYRSFDLDYGFQNQYLLCYGDMLVEMYFDWEPTSDQMKIVSEKLLNNIE